MLRAVRRLSSAANAQLKPAAGLQFETVGLQAPKVAVAEPLLGEEPGIVAFGAGAVNNTLLALMSQVSSELTLVSNYGDHVAAEGVTLLHRGGEFHVPPGTVKVVAAGAVAGGDPTVVINGRQLGGDYDAIFHALGPSTEVLITAQNGPSARMLADAAADYLARFPDRAAVLEGVVGVDAAMFVKMSATDSKAATLLQPGAKWIFGAYELVGGKGVEPGVAVSEGALAKAEAFVEWFRLLDATDAGAEETHVALRPEAVSGKIAKTANNIGGNYGAAIVTKLVQGFAAANGKKLEAPLPYGVLHPDFDLGSLEALVGAENLAMLKHHVAAARDMSLAAVGEYYDVHEELFEDAGLTKNEVLEAARLYWTEFDAAGDRVPSKHPPTHALSVFEGRPSEPLLEDVVDAVGECQTPEMRQLLTSFRRVEAEYEPLAHDFKWNKTVGWLEKPAVEAVRAAVTKAYDPVELAKIQANHYQKPLMPGTFVEGLRDMGEHAMSFQERLGEYKAFFEALPTSPPFFNLTIGGVYRDTPDRTNYTNVSRGYVTHATAKDKEIVADIFQRLGVDVEPRQVAISALRSKVLLQHLLSLFKPGKVVAHMPTYGSTTDAARNTSSHEIVEVRAGPGRFGELFAATRKAAAEAKEGEPVVLLLLEPHNPTAISMNAEEAEEFHAVVRECPNVSVIHDIAYQGYHPQQLDSGKRYRDEGMPHKDQLYVAVLSTSKSMYASGQPALYMADKDSLPFLVDHYQRVATGPTSVFVHDLPYYRDTLDDGYMPSVHEKLQKPMLAFIDERLEKWGVTYLARPDGPPFITLDVNAKLENMGLSNKGLRELSLRLGCPVLVDSGVLRIALTGFDKSKHDEVLPDILERLDFIMSLGPEDDIVKTFKQYNPYYASTGKAASTVMG